MGSRANVYVRQEEDGSGVYLYTHNKGYELAQTVQAALARGVRWDDPPYLARIIFSEMIGNNAKGEIGFGISARIGDNSYQIVVVDTTVKGGRIGFADPPKHRDEPQPFPKKWLPFAEFVKLDANGISALGWE